MACARLIVDDSSIQVVKDTAAEVPPPDMITEGGDTPAARRCTLLDLALCFAGGLPPSGLLTLFNAARAGLTVRSAPLMGLAADLCLNN